MTAKRSRLGRSSSGGATVLPPPPLRSPPNITPMFPPPNQIRTTMTTDNKQPSRKQRIFTVSEPVNEFVDRNVWFKIGGFLDTCCFCKKKIPDNSDVFMYRDLGAYCTVECRQKQIDIDTDRAMMNANPLAKWLYSELHPLLAKAKKRGGVAGS